MDINCYGGGFSRTIYALFLGQMASVFLTLMAFSSSLVANLGVDAPLALSFLSYLAVVLVYGSILIYRREKLRVPWYWYALLGFADSQGSVLVNKAYQFTSITSVTILDCWTLAWVIVLTWIFLGARYSAWQFGGVAACLVGLALVLLSDAGVGGGGGSRPILGDIAVIASTFLFSFSNVGEEFCVKHRDLVEAVTMKGFFGMLVTACELALLEWKILESMTWSAELILAFSGFAVSSLMFCTFVPFVLKMSGSTLLNLSVLTSDMYAVIIRIFFYNQQVDFLYYAAFAFVVVGLIIYSKAEKYVAPSLPSEDENSSRAYQQLLHEQSSDPQIDFHQMVEH